MEAIMGLVKKSITVTDHQEKWIKAQVESGQYGNDSEYFRDLLRRDEEQNAKFQALKAAIQEGLDLLRRDEEQNAKFQALKAAIQEGLDSGVSDKTVLDVWREAEERYTAKHG
jgi:antitoxin ParD1/3/4